MKQINKRFFSLQIGDTVQIDDYAFDTLRKIYDILSYREPKAVIEYAIYNDGNDMQYLYELCPRCNAAISRTYQSACESCGQMLKWIDREKMHLSTKSN